MNCLVFFDCTFKEISMSSFSAKTSNRRVFMMQVATAATAVLAVSEASAQARVDEKDPQAVGLAYKADATKVDKAKNPKYAAGNNCANCAALGRLDSGIGMTTSMSLGGTVEITRLAKVSPKFNRA